MKDLISILIPIYNNSKYTKECIESIYKTTHCILEIIIIDNGSTDNSLEVLSKLKEKKPENVVDFLIIKNKKNVGVIKAFNQGIKKFKGQYLLLQNNDCLMCNGWLDEMKEAIKEVNGAGIVGPLTNLYKGKKSPYPQLVYADYKSVYKMDSFCKRIQTNSEKYLELSFVFGHCMLIERRVFEEIGNFDTRYGIGYCEEVDFCKRAKIAGFKIIIANRSFIHHYGNKTFDLLELKSNELMEKSKKKYLEKWGEEFNER